MLPHHCAGYLYVASNASMPGLIKAGRTQTSVHKRLRCLYSTGVPCPFVTESARFFIDCFKAEQSYLNTLAGQGKRCENREFFLIDKKKARDALNDLYSKQYCLFDSGKSGFDEFEAVAEECFEQLHRLGQLDLAEQTVRALKILPYARREQLSLSILAYVMKKRDERFASWLITSCGIDPEMAMRYTTPHTRLGNYYLTAYEYSIYSKLSVFERRLANIGCRAYDSPALCYCIDTLINGNNILTEKLLQFSIDLIELGADLQRVLNVGCFAEAPKTSCDFRFDVFPRNSNLSCADIIENLAPKDQRFAIIYDHMKKR